MTQRLADYIADFLTENGITDCFTVTGGGAMHLNDAFGHHNKLRTLYHHHEQACSMAAEGYARLSGKPAAVCVTTGPGGTNAITGVLGAYLDSIPMMVISGQVKYETTVHSSGLPLRQLGDQEFDIVSSVKTMTKYAVMVTEKNSIRYHLEKALFLALNGRKGPVWLDIPLDIQAAIIDTDNLFGYNPSEDSDEIPPFFEANEARLVLELIKNAKRPVLMAGAGIRLSDAHSEFLALIDLLNIPVVTPWNSHDNIWNDHSLFAGRPGNMGERAGNFVVQNSDLLLSLGCRLSIRQVSYNYESFAREAYKIMVDIDPAELKKPTLNIDMPILADAGDFIDALLRELKGESLPKKTQWLKWCKEKGKRFPVLQDKFYKKSSPINPYVFIGSLFSHLKNDDIVVCGNGTACVVTFQAAYLKPGQRLFHNSGCASMGFGLPAAIGASIAAGKKRIVCLDGDGSFQMNLQELATTAYHNLPITIFLLNNSGYHSIRQTQKSFFGEPLVGVDNSSGIGFPDAKKIAAAYGIPFLRADNHNELNHTVNAALSVQDGPMICEIILDINQPFEPKLSSRTLDDGRMVSSPLEDMAPFLPRDEFLKEMLLSPIDTDKK